MGKPDEVGDGLFSMSKTSKLVQKGKDPDHETAGNGWLNGVGSSLPGNGMEGRFGGDTRPPREEGKPS